MSEWENKERMRYNKASGNYLSSYRYPRPTRRTEISSIENGISWISINSVNNQNKTSLLVKLRLLGREPLGTDCTKNEYVWRRNCHPHVEVEWDRWKSYVNNITHARTLKQSVYTRTAHTHTHKKKSLVRVPRCFCAFHGLVIILLSGIGYEYST